MSKKTGLKKIVLLTIEEVDFTKIKKKEKQRIKSPRSLNAIAALGLKPDDLYLVTFKEFIKQNPEFKKQSKELQKQRYELHEQQRQKNIERCISKRKEIIANTKKIKPSVNNYDNNEENEELDEDNEEIKLDLDYKLKLTEKPLRNSESYNYIRRTNHSKDSDKKPKMPPEKKILVTASSYILSDSRGKKSEITKDALFQLPCLQTEKKKLDKKIEDKDDHFMRYLKVQLNNAKKLKKTKAKIELKEHNLENFLKIKNIGKKLWTMNVIRINKILMREKKFLKKCQLILMKNCICINSN
jgi:hypothetical protein